MPPRRYAIALAALAILAACSMADESKSPAFRIAQLFVTLDTLGDRGAADTLLAGCEDSTDEDAVTPTSGVSIGSPLRAPGSDLTTVIVTYEVLGRAHADQTPTGARTWHFRSAPGRDTLVLRIAPDSTGHLRIACGPTADHVMLTQLGGAISAMDQASLADLERAKHGRASAIPEPEPVPPTPAPTIAPAAPASAPAPAPAPTPPPADSR